jgi:hypothetical protein
LLWGKKMEQLSITIDSGDKRYPLDVSADNDETIATIQSFTPPQLLVSERPRLFLPYVTF